MQSLHFYKYQATGNDFVIIDNREQKFSPTKDQITLVCHRRWGIGADGLILLEQHTDADFKMVYYNSDGTQSLCGNGCRAAVKLATHLKMVGKQSSFIAFDGLHQASVTDNNQIRLAIGDVRTMKKIHDDWLIDTGSPHYIQFVDQLSSYNVTEEGRKIRYSRDLQPQGANVNFAKLLSNNAVAMRTYERGVEAETLSCGTGAVAVALAASFRGYQPPVTIETEGGRLVVAFEHSARNLFSQIFLIGAAKRVFEGNIML